MDTISPNINSNSSNPPQGHRTFINPFLWFDDWDGFRVFFCRHEILYRVALNDHAHLKIIAVTLRQSRLATQQEIAMAFGHAVATQRRWEKLYAQFGSAAFAPKPHTGRPRRLNTAQHAFVRRWFLDHLPLAEIARRLQVDEATVRRLLRHLGLSRSSGPHPELPFPPSTETPDQPSSVPPVPSDLEPPRPPSQGPSSQRNDSEPPTCPPDNPLSAHPQTVPPLPTPLGFTIDGNPLDRSGDRFLAQHGLLEDAVPLFANTTDLPRTGVLLAIPALAEHGGLSVFQHLYRSLGPAFYGLRTIVLTLVLLALLRVKRPENLKEYSPQQLGRLLGLDRAPEVKTLRRKLSRLAARSLTGKVLEELTRLRLSQQEDRLAFLYLDGHVREYTGQEALAKAKKAQRAVATPATTDTWVHDAQGEPVLVVTSEMNAGLTKVLLPIIAEVQKLLPAGQRVTAVFDRGGWSPKLFERLLACGVDILTYRKGKKRKLPEQRFVEHRVVIQGQEKVYHLCDQRRVRAGRLRGAKRKRRRGDGPEYLWLRQVTVRREASRQTAVLTNRQDLGAVAVVQHLLERWTQENYFKYMDEEYALDALVEYGAEEVSPTEDRPNPERQRLVKKRQRVGAELMRLQAELGVASEAATEGNPSLSDFQAGQAELRGRMAVLAKRVARLTTRIRKLPKRVPATGVKKLKGEKKRFVDIVKMIAYQIETMMLREVSKYYVRSEDEGRTLLTAIYQSSGRLEVADGELRITLARQSSPHRTEVLRKFRTPDIALENARITQLRLQLHSEMNERL